MKATLVVKSRFQFFHLARQLEKKGLLEKIYSGYPKFKLKDETGIPVQKIKTYPWFQAPYMRRGVFGLDKFDKLEKNWKWVISQTLDKHVARRILKPGYLISMSSTGLIAGRKMRELGGRYICSRGSSHILYQDEIIKKEYENWGYEWKGIDQRIVEKELMEYEEANFITVPSEYAKKTFIEKGIDPLKIYKTTYGARLDRFNKMDKPQPGKFQVLWVGAISIIKGFMYALEAFEKLRHPNKEFVVIGMMSKEIKELLSNKNLKNVTFKGHVPNTELVKFYNTSNVFVFPSLDDGFGIVLSEALACGCPVISTSHTGSTDLYDNEKEGFIVPIRSVKGIEESFEKLIQTEKLGEEMSNNALKKVKEINGWNSYGDSFELLLNRLK